MDIFFYITIFILGLAFGSFLNVLIYRLPLGKKITGRSFCPKCKKKISWYDNIPILSFILLKGKCRNCRKKISLAYPFGELLIGIVFVVIFYFFKNCGSFLGLQTPFCFWVEKLGYWSLPYFFSTSLLLIAVFIIDFQERIIPDSLVFIGILLSFLVLIFTNDTNIFVFLLSGFSASLFLLVTHLLTKGKGMGLGDVKLAVFLGTVLGWPWTLHWLFLAFLTGALIGTILVIVGKAKFGEEIPFAPFLIIAFFAILIFGNYFKFAIIF